MLLRRIIKHFRAQNWAAVAIDFVIVVVGVFLGIQVSNWNDAQQRRRHENNLLVRLYHEIGELDNARNKDRTEILERKKTLYALRPILFSEALPRALTQDECRMISKSHISPRPPDDLPALDEMVATGSIDVLANAEIKKKLREFLLYRERARAWHREGATDLFRLAHLYPDLLKIDFVPTGSDEVAQRTLMSEGGLTNTVFCELPALKASQAFLNDYADNLGRLTATVNYNYEEMDKHLEDLRRLLEAKTKCH